MQRKSLQRKKVRTASLSIISNSVLIVLKVTIGIISGSVSIISEAIHSGMDLMAAIIAFFSVRISGMPPDKNHQYGHGKFENVSGVIEALLIFIAAGWIILEAVKKIVEPTVPESLGIGAIVMGISALINFIVSQRLYKVGRETDSVALEADGLHLRTDVFTSLGVAVGLVLIWLTNVAILDPIVAILVALLILRESFILLKKAYYPLLDTPLPSNEIDIIENIITSHLRPGMSFHMLRSRKAGALKYVDLHLEVPGSITVKESHDLCNLIENEIEHQFENIEVYIHIEPSENDPEEKGL
ncbi:MAG TPA: cation diffusion facilitator family transporter [Bacteroidales bacterium]|jgi:cation diffusion facilitator family transporter|nr:cation transporter [Bacteroidales bacterium]HPB26295.1 cation diffusion facilitator family transporter [Bacteroidales bacterium]